MLKSLVFLISIGACIFFLNFVSKRLPVLGLLLGAALCSTPFFIWLGSSKSDFQSDGSAAGLFIFLLYVVLGLFCVSVGAGTFVQSLKTLKGGSPLSTEPVSAPSERAQGQTPAPADADLKRWHGVVALVISILFFVFGFRLILGFDTWSCGRKGCDITAWIHEWGGDVGVGLSYFLVGALFLVLARKAMGRGKSSPK